MSSQEIDPIASLDPNKKKTAWEVWKVKARVANKSGIRSWNNDKGSGQYFHFNLLDDSGEIKATAFKQHCDKFYDKIQEGKMYYLIILNINLKPVNKNFNKLKHKYEITFSENTEVTECMEDATSVPTNSYDFVPFIDIRNKAVDTQMDVIGVCTYAENEIQKFTSKAGNPLKKRKIYLVDSSGATVDVTLWNNEAEKFDGTSQPVVLVTGARLNEYNGRKSLCLTPSSNLLLEPDLPQARELRDWYNNGGATEVANMSAKSGGSGGGNTDWITFAEAEARQLGSANKVDFYSHLGVLALPIADYAVYKACPLKRCNKKLEHRENGVYFCEKCNKECEHYKYRLLLKATVSDPTDDREITAFNEAAEAILGASAAEVGRLLDHDKIAYVRLFEDAKFKTFVFKYSVKTETYNDKARLNITVLSATPVDFFNGNARLIKNIKSITGVVA